MRWGQKHGHAQMYDRLTRARATSGCESVHPIPGGMLETAENLRRKFAISREEQDAYAVRSHHRAAAAWDAGKFTDHIVPIYVPGRAGFFAHPSSAGPPQCPKPGASDQHSRGSARRTLRKSSAYSGSGFPSRARLRHRRRSQPTDAAERMARGRPNSADNLPRPDIRSTALGPG